MTGRYSPLSSGGADVDMVTGRPMDSPRPVDDMMAQLQEQVTDAMTLAGELNSPVGKRFISEIERLMSERIEWFLRQDEMCKTCLILLESLGAKINTAPERAKQQIDRLLHHRATRF